MTTATLDPALFQQAVSFRRRAASLRTQAESLPQVLADTYRRRASELELGAFVSEVQSGIPYDDVHRPA